MCGVRCARRAIPGDKYSYHVSFPRPIRIGIGKRGSGKLKRRLMPVCHHARIKYTMQGARKSVCRSDGGNTPPAWARKGRRWVGGGWGVVEQEGNFYEQTRKAVRTTTITQKCNTLIDRKFNERRHARPNPIYKLPRGGGSGRETKRRAQEHWPKRRNIGCDYIFYLYVCGRCGYVRSAVCGCARCAVCVCIPKLDILWM